MTISLFIISNQSLPLFTLKTRGETRELVCGASLNRETLQSLVHGIFVGEILKQLVLAIPLEKRKCSNYEKNMSYCHSLRCERLDWVLIQLGLAICVYVLSSSRDECYKTIWVSTWPTILSPFTKCRSFSHFNHVTNYILDDG